MNNPINSSNSVNNSLVNVFLDNLDFIYKFFSNNYIDLTPNKNNIIFESFPKYLTSPLLFNLQLNDINFRKNIIIQILIVLKSFLKPIST